MGISADEMDQADDELKETIKNIWPLQAKNMVDLLVPSNDQLNMGKLTVGKIYAGLLILESWRSTRFGQVEPTGLPVSKNPIEMICYHTIPYRTTDITGRTFLRKMQSHPFYDLEKFVAINCLKFDCLNVYVDVVNIFNLPFLFIGVR